RRGHRVAGLPAGNSMATTFLVSLNTPLNMVGTYSYAIGVNNIHDNIRNKDTTGGGGASTLNQFANSVIAFSSEFNPSPGTFSAFQATGAPDTPTYGDRTTAWAALNRDGPPNPEFLTLGYATPVFATG